MLLDEALKHVKETQPPETVQSWIELLSGEYGQTLHDNEYSNDRTTFVLAVSTFKTFQEIADIQMQAHCSFKAEQREICGLSEAEKKC